MLLTGLHPEKQMKMLRELMPVIPGTIKLCLIYLGKIRIPRLSTVEDRLTSYVLSYILKKFSKRKAKNDSLMSVILYD